MLGDVDSCTWAGPAIEIHCAACDVANAPAETYEYGERLTLLHIVPITPYRRIKFVKCNCCGELFISPIPLDDLPFLHNGELYRVLRRHVPLVPKFLALTAIILCWIPMLGLIMAALALAMNGWRKKHWTRIVSRAAMVIAVITSGLTGVMMLLAKLGLVK